MLRKQEFGTGVNWVIRRRIQWNGAIETVILRAVSFQLAIANELGLNLQAGPSGAPFRQVVQVPEWRSAWSGLLQNQILTRH